MYLRSTFIKLSVRRHLTKKKEVGKRDKTEIIGGNKCYHAIDHLEEKRYMTLSFTVGLCKTKRTSVTSGVESRTLITKMESGLIRWEKKISRKIYKATYENGNCRMKIN
jgi:hypothetical protein